MSRHLYKQFVRLSAKWPKDQFKAPERDLATFMTRDVERQFAADSTCLPSEPGLCERRLRALEQLYGNQASQLFPHKYTSGVFGLNLHQLQDASREENRKHFGLTSRDNILKKAWKAVFPSSPKNASS